MQKLLDKNNRLSDYGAQIALALLIIAVSFISPEFRTLGNAFLLLRQSSVNGLIAFGMTCVILTGGIDLSVGSVLCLTALMEAAMIKAGVPAAVAMFACLCLGAAAGLCNGLLVVKCRLQPFIATLVSMTAFRGAAMIFCNGRPISSLGESPLLSFLGRGSVLNVPVPVWILAAVFCLFLFTLQKTVLGRMIYATGSNKKAAELAGIRTDTVTALTYVVCGAVSALAGGILVSRLGSAQPTMGSGYELDAIAAVALGGASMNGGRGKIWGTLTGVIIIATLNNSMNIIGISSYYQQIAKAAVILLAVVSDRSR